MAQNLLSSKPGATYVGIETTFATATTATRIYPVEESVEVDFQQDEVMNEAEQPSLLEQPDPVRGLKSTSSTAKFRHYLRPNTTQLTGAAVPTTPPCMIPVKACFGGESVSHNSGVGTTVGAAATVSSVPVVSATGLLAGQWVLIGVAGELQPALITAVATNTLSVWPDLPAIPASGQLVVGMYNYFLTEANTQSLTFDRAITGDSSLQWRGTGGVPKLTFTWERGKILEYAAEIKVASWSGPQALGISTAIATDPMAAPWVLRDGVTLLQSPSTTTRTHYGLRSLKFEIADSLEHVPELVNSTEGVAGVMRVGARPVAKLTVRFTSDTARYSNWGAQAKLALVAIATQGSGTTKRVAVVSALNCVPVGVPKWTNEGGQWVAEMVLHAKLAQITGAPTFVPGTSDRQYTPLMLSVG